MPEPLSDKDWVARARAKMKILDLKEVRPNVWRLELECGHVVDRNQKTRPSMYSTLCKDCLKKMADIRDRTGGIDRRLR